MAKSQKFITICFTVLLAMGLFLGNAQKAQAGFSILDLFKPKGAEKSADKYLKASLEDNPSLPKTIDGSIANHINGFKFHVSGVESGVSAAFWNSLSKEDQISLTDKYGNGAIGDVTSWIAYLYTPPASSQTYIADILNDMHIIPKAYAQGVGFASLDPILETWKVFRNTAYMFFVLIFIIIGFMIMLRSKIDGQTVVTAQQAIPQIIISLLFVTFSYAIAGFLIDAMYLLMYLMIGLFGENAELLNKNFLQMGVEFVTSGTSSTFSTVNEAVKEMADIALIGDALGFTSGVLLALIIGIAILIGVFQLFFELLKTYVTIVINIAFSPITLMFGAMPGKKVFAGWIKNLIGNLLVFPAVLLILIMHKKMTDVSITTGGFVPPYLLTNAGGAGNALTAAVGIGLLLVMPEIVKKIKEAFGADKGMFAAFMAPLEKAIGQGWKGGEIIPGVGWTNTANLPFGGLSGENALRKGMIGTSSTIMGGAGTAKSIYDTTKHGGRIGKAVTEGWQKGSRLGGRVASDITDDKEAFAKGRDDRKKAKNLHEKFKEYTKKS